MDQKPRSITILLTQTADKTTQLQALIDKGLCRPIAKIPVMVAGLNLEAVQFLTQTADGETQLQALIAQGFDAYSITKIVIILADLKT